VGISISGRRKTHSIAFRLYRSNFRTVSLFSVKLDLEVITQDGIYRGWFCDDAGHQPYHDHLGLHLCVNFLPLRLEDLDRAYACDAFRHDHGRRIRDRAMDCVSYCEILKSQFSSFRKGEYGINSK
jgi:hypothetical protein